MIISNVNMGSILRNGLWGDLAMDEEQYKAHIKKTIEYNRTHMKQIKINLRRTNPEDAEIIDYLESVENVQGLLKNLLREHMNTTK